MSEFQNQLKALIVKEVRSILIEDEEQLTLPGVENSEPRKIVSYYEKWDQEALEAGDTDDRGENDEYEIELDDIDKEDDKTIVDLAVEYLKYNFAHDPSSSHFHPGIWYTATDEHPYTGVVENITYHLKGFTEAEEAEVFETMAR